MRRLSFADEARADLRRLQRLSVRRWGRALTTDYMEQLLLSFDRIRMRKLPGVARDEIARGYRSMRCGRHVIYFRLTQEEALISRILHDRIDHAANLIDI